MTNINNKSQITVITEDQNEEIILKKADYNVEESLQTNRMSEIANLKSAFVNKAESFKGSLGLAPSIYGHNNGNTVKSIVENFADLEIQSGFESFDYHLPTINIIANKAEISLNKQHGNLHEIIFYRKRRRSVLPNISDGKINEFCSNEANDFFAKYIDDNVFKNEDDTSAVSEIQGIGKLGKEQTHKIPYNSLKAANILDILLKLQEKLENNLIHDSIWLTSPRVWLAIRAIKDKNGNFIITEDKLFNKQVIIHSGFENTESSIMLANLKKGLKVIATDVEHYEQDDTDSSNKIDCLRKGVSVYTKNERAFVSLVITDLPEKGQDINFNGIEA